MECCTPEFEQLPLLTRELTAVGLDWLARFHAVGQAMKRTEQGKGLAVWPTGGHTALPNRPADEVDKLAVGFDRLRASFADQAEVAAAGPGFVLPPADLGQRLQAVAMNVDRWIAEASQWRTLIHGDFKVRRTQPSLALPRQPRCSYRFRHAPGEVACRSDRLAPPSLLLASLAPVQAGNLFVKPGGGVGSEMCVIDFQWTGWNIAQHDVVYFLSTSADPASCEGYMETLAVYHKAFVAALPAELQEFHHPPPATCLHVSPPSLTRRIISQCSSVRPKQGPGLHWPLEETVRLFKLTLLDYMRWALAYRLVSPQESPEQMIKRAAAAAATPPDVNAGEYRRSPARLSWLLKLAAEFLPLAESGALGTLGGCAL